VSTRVDLLSNWHTRTKDKLGRGAAPLLQFAVVGASGMVPDLLCFATLLTWLPVPLARATAIWVAMTWNFLLNRWLTFSDARTQSAVRQYGETTGVS